ncbi:Predicted Zn-dependent protease, minimal metalloprotease (MMP)-like domain [Tistlia consotensis]|uniref:Predicted Zn-dependent protease, minimal metalloprotease (MMP)-like domain n=1 Tax=Tistlia consotensis USBA 355 TaxID=560819 RepID=A0A1Y6BW44_9PROT|nr:metallopeptidase family protein [Tistlia consotensis]SMF32041.1 Predicted Zn-dependent protease, minimal metalloprotease (MMP)-like domain [Tistlia consotensis USBA 355]SNR68021.1 Predicted Zn-dependent protease, minimal metalloprotease (MMP)-like domain [Tistlia consotensis]
MARPNLLHRYGAPPTIEDMEAMAREALSAIPVQLRRFVENVAIRVEDFPDDETMDEMDLESHFDILGLYRGVDLTRQSVMAQPQDIDQIYLYRRPILDYWCESEEDLTRVVRHVLIHEIGHHFGLSDDDMERIEQEA